MKTSFKRELKRQTRLAIAAAIGFIIAYGWRNAIFDTFESFVVRFFDVPAGHYSTEVYTALVMTTMGIILILATSKILED